jgi:hypothetical protein
MRPSPDDGRVPFRERSAHPRTEPSERTAPTPSVKLSPIATYRTRPILP